jgi:RNA polymerase sigma-70 factor (ECF subfamily)
MEHARTLTDVDDSSLVARARAGDRPAFEALMRRYNRTVFRAARGVLRASDGVEDAVQLAWITAHGKLAQLTDASAFRPWIVRIVVHEALRRVRIDGRARLHLVADDDEGETHAVSREPDPERQAARVQISALVEQLLDALTPEQRIVFVLRHVEGMSTAQVAEALGVSEGAVKVRIHRARAAMQQRFTAELDDALPDAWPFAGERCDRVVAFVLTALDDRPPK